MSRPDFNRRQALAALGTVSLGAVIAACSSDSQTQGTPGGTATGLDEAASCTLSPEQTEGPYYFDVNSIRSDIRGGRDGVLLQLTVRVRDATTCEPITNAVVDIWQCDATGAYSGFEAASAGARPGGRLDDKTYLRGAQVTDANGATQFTTVYPGWYPGRTAHIHVKVHLDNRTVLTTQLYFPEAINDAVYAEEPYASDIGHDTTNATDSIFDPKLVMTVEPNRRGYAARMTINVQT